jgi:PhoD-like phosphatase
MPGLVLGPLLRYADETSVTIWAQTDVPGTVEVRCPAAPPAARPTFTVHDHHYAIVPLEGLPSGGRWPYTVHLDGEQVWPEPDTEFPPSELHTIDPDRPLRLTFGSCRTTAPHDLHQLLTHGVDMLRSYAFQLARDGELDPPSVLLLLGDQVYADEPPPQMLDLIKERREPGEEPATEIADYAEYAELYRLAWSEPALRWLLSTVPTAMIFDDHDLRDDWNTSDTWKERMRAQPWWRRRVTAGLGAYWVYQHLGNLSPAELADDPVLDKVTSAGGDAGELLDEFGWALDTEPDRYRWSYARDYGRNRIVLVDSRCARVLTPGGRAMLDRAEWEWFEQVATGDVDHLVIGSSLPVLLPQGLHQLERWNEAVCDGVWGGRAARLGERLRQFLDLEHWGAFRTSFDALARCVIEIAAGRRGSAPASVLFLSGDVHYSYLARARIRRARTGVYQVVCSPIRNPLKRTWRVLNAIASFGVAGLVGRGLARSAGVRRPPFSWSVRRGPFFQNMLCTLDLAGRDVTLRYETAAVTEGDPPPLKTVAEERLPTGNRA